MADCRDRRARFRQGRQIQFPARIRQRISRQQRQRKQPRPALQLDADPYNADWTKQTADVDLARLRRALRARGYTPEEIARYPAIALATPPARA